MNVFEWIVSVVKTSWNSLVQTWPEDKEQRRRMQACMRGGGMCGHSVSIIETETSDTESKKEGAREVANR